MAYSEGNGTVDQYQALISVALNRIDASSSRYNRGGPNTVYGILHARAQFQGVGSNEMWNDFMAGTPREFGRFQNALTAAAGMMQAGAGRTTRATYFWWGKGGPAPARVGFVGECGQPERRGSLYLYTLRKR